jgi:zinc protease
MSIYMNSIIRLRRSLIAVSLLLLTAGFVSAQVETPPAPQPPKSIRVPAVVESKLANGLTVASVERKSTPLVTVVLMVKGGASAENATKAGLANLTASLLVKGTKTRSATQVAEDIEFLGGSLNTGAGWNNSVVNLTVTPDKLDAAMAILSDVVLNPSFQKDELDLLRSQALDGLTYNLKQPGFLATYVASKYSFNEHPAGGTPASLAAITRDDVAAFHSANYLPGQSVLIFAGDIAPDRAKLVSEKFFGNWKGGSARKTAAESGAGSAGGNGTLNRILVVDLPNSGQASVNYMVRSFGVGRTSPTYFPANVLNAVLGGGYSSRLNQEIRIKRGLSYGAGSGFSWRQNLSNFSARTQTKNESAAEVAELVVGELKRLGESPIAESELVPRKSVLTGTFGRNLETTGGLAGAIADLYSFGVPTSELNTYMKSVEGVSDAQIREFATKNFVGGDLVIAGDAKAFMDDLKKRFPNAKIDVIKSDELDLGKDTLRKS